MQRDGKTFYHNGENKKETVGSRGESLSSSHGSLVEIGLQASFFMKIDLVREKIIQLYRRYASSIFLLI